MLELSLDFITWHLFDLSEHSLYLFKLFLLFLARGDYGGNPCYCRSFKQLAERYLNLELLAQLRDHLDRQQRVASEAEKIILNADAVNAKQVPPYVGGDFLYIGYRSDVLHTEAGPRVGGR